jgi:hypothetical protein
LKKEEGLNFFHEKLMLKGIDKNNCVNPFVCGFQEKFIKLLYRCQGEIRHCLKLKCYRGG